MKINFFFFFRILPKNQSQFVHSRIFQTKLNIHYNGLGMPLRVHLLKRLCLLYNILPKLIFLIKIENSKVTSQWKLWIKLLKSSKMICPNLSMIVSHGLENYLRNYFTIQLRSCCIIFHQTNRHLQVCRIK